MKLPVTRPWASRTLAAFLSAIRALAWVLGRAHPSRRRRLAWRELGNKLYAVATFEAAAGPRGASAPGHRAAAGRGSDATRFGRLWRTEGDGFRQAPAAGDEPGGELPLHFLHRAAPGALVPLHAGLGAALATRALDRAEDGAALGAALDRLLSGSGRWGLPGWDGALLEALGLAVRLGHPGRVAAVDRHLVRRGDEPRGYLWHGIGRAQYFLPAHLAPFRDPAGRSLAKALGEPPAPALRDQAVAGLALALTLVNLRHPEVVEGFLLQHGEWLPTSDAFEHGLLAALTVWRWAAPDGPPGGLFAGHRPRPEAEAVWERRVRRPIREHLAILAADLERRERRGELFLYRPLSTLPRDAARPADAPR